LEELKGTPPICFRRVNEKSSKILEELMGTPLVLSKDFSTTFGGFHGNSSDVNQRNFDKLFWYKPDLFP
jgi:hypothetical protein